MSDLVVKPWARYGYDRLYVQRADGIRLGYLDNKTGSTVLEDENYRGVFDAALAAHRNGAGPERPARPVIPVQPSPPGFDRPASGTASASGAAVPAAPPSPAAPTEARLAPGSVAVAALVAEEPVEPEWQDLAGTKAGAAAREQAVASKRAAPVRTLLARAFRVKTDERAWRIGADAEEAVAARLAKLGDRWRVLPAVPVGKNGSDIDHVVIGPGGVFTINTKHHPDAAVWVGGNTFMVNGHRVPYVRNSRFEAQRTSRFLTSALGGAPVSTTALIVVMGARKGFKIKSQPPDGSVIVVTRREVANWLAKRPEVLSDEQVKAIYSMARRSDTWK